MAKIIGDNSSFINEESDNKFSIVVMIPLLLIVTLTM